MYKPTPKGSITTYNGNYKDIVDNIKNKDVIFFDPPWTEEGVPYDKKNPSVPKLGDKTIFEVMEEMSKLYKYIFVKLPLNLKVDEKVFHVKKFLK